MMAGGGGAAAVDHNGIYSNPNLHSLQQPLMEAENADSRKRPLETSVEEAGCTKRTNVGGRRCTARSSSATVSHLRLVRSVHAEAFCAQVLKKKQPKNGVFIACPESTRCTEADWLKNTQRRRLIWPLFHVPTGRSGNLTG